MSVKRVKSPVSSPSLIRQLAFDEDSCSDKKTEGGLDFFGGDSVLLGDIAAARRAVTPFRPIYVFNLDVKGTVWVALSTLALRSIAIPGVPGASRVGGVTTITTTATHGYAVGDVVEVENVTNATFNGVFTITSIPTAMTFTYAQALANATSGNGTVGMPTPGIGTGIVIQYGDGIMLASGENTWIYSTGGADVFAYQASDNVQE